MDSVASTYAVVGDGASVSSDTWTLAGVTFTKSGIHESTISLYISKATAKAGAVVDE
jgi:hypothetical protein